MQPATVPTAGATVPTNARSLYVTGYDLVTLGTPVLVDATAQTETTTGAPVQESGRGALGLVRIPLLSPLVAGHDYHLSARSPGVATDVVGFVASLEPAPTVPAIPDLVGLDLATARFGAQLASSCGAPLTGFRGTLSNLDAGTVLVVRITGPNGAVIERVVRATPDALATLGSGACTIDTPLEPGVRYSVDISARDLAGTEGAARHADITARDCGVVASYADIEQATACVFAGASAVSAPPGDGAPANDDAGGCSTGGGGSPFALLGVLGLARRRRS